MQHNIIRFITMFTFNGVSPKKKLVTLKPTILEVVVCKCKLNFFTEVIFSHITNICSMISISVSQNPQQSPVLILIFFKVVTYRENRFYFYLNRISLCHAVNIFLYSKQTVPYLGLTCSRYPNS